MANSNQSEYNYDHFFSEDEELDLNDVWLAQNSVSAFKRNIFHLYKKCNPTLFDEEVLPRIENKYYKYFDIFDHPMYTKKKARLSLRRIICDETFFKRFINILKGYKYSNDLYTILLYLIADVTFFTKTDYLHGFFQEGGVSRTKKINKELDQLFVLNGYYEDNDINTNPVESISFKIKNGENIIIKDKIVIARILSQMFDRQSRLIGKRSTNVNDQMPLRDDFLSIIRQKFICALHNFIVEELKIGSDEDTTSKEQLIFISEFLTLCNIPLKHKIKDDSNEIKRLDIIRTIILRGVK